MISHSPALSSVAALLLLMSQADCVKDEPSAEPQSKMPADEKGSLLNEKESRTAAQKKLDSHLVLALKKSRSEPPFDKPTSLDTDLVIEADGRVQVDLTATVTAELLGQITASGGTVVSSFETMRAIRAKIPLGQLEAIAARADVTFISPAAQAVTNQTDKASSAPAGGAGIHP